MKTLNISSILLLIAMLIAAGCSGGGDQANNESQSSTSSSESETMNDGTRSVDVIGIDKLMYVVAEQKDWLDTGKEMTLKGNTYYVLNGMSATAGQELTVNLKTISNLPPQSMSHNWLLLMMDSDAKAFNDASIQAKDNDYISPDMEDQVIIDTGLVGDGETQSITFNAPDEQGAYDYICTFPGHFTAGMKGTLTVE